MEPRKTRLPQFIDLEDKNQNLAPKSFRRRSISQAHKKPQKNQMLELGLKDGEKLVRIGPTIHEIKFSTDRRIKNPVYPYHGF